MPGRYYPQYDASDLMRAGGGNPFYNPYMKGPDISGFGQLIGGILKSIQASKMQKEKKALFEQEQAKKQKDEEYKRAMEEAKFGLEREKFGFEQEKVGIQTEEKRRAAQTIEDKQQIEAGTKYHKAKEYRQQLAKAFGKKIPEWLSSASDDFVLNVGPKVLEKFFSESVMPKGTEPTGQQKFNTRAADNIYSVMESVEKQLADIEKIRIAAQEKMSLDPIVRMQAQKTGQPIMIDPKVESNLNAMKEKVITNGRKGLVAAVNMHWNQVPPESRSYTSSQILSKLGKLDPNEFDAVSAIVPDSGQTIPESLIPKEHKESNTYLIKRGGSIFYYDPRDGILKKVEFGK